MTATKPDRLISKRELRRELGVGYLTLEGMIERGSVTPIDTDPVTGRHLFHLPTVRRQLESSIL